MKIIRAIGNKFYEEITKGIRFIYLLKKRENREITLQGENTEAVTLRRIRDLFQGCIEIKFSHWRYAM